jgi:phospholipid/cholesterol/gamma-HCH transport system ATP-binding protein
LVTTIQLKGVSKAYGDQKVLSGLDLDIPQGKITVIIGRSGEGKSVLLKHMLGLICPDSGTVCVGGKDLAKLNPVELNELRKKFGMLFQNAALFDSMTVFDNIAFPLVEHRGLSEAALKKAVSELLAIVGLRTETMDKYPSQLSGGMRKRVGLARAIALKPEILLYDEPTTGLDPVMTDVIDHLILNTQRTLGMTSVVISHDIAATFSIADNIVMLQDGQVLMQGTPDEFRQTKNPDVRAFLEGRATDEQKAML